MAGSAINWESLAREDAIGPIVSSGRYRLDSPSTVTGSPTFAMGAAGQSATIRVFLPSGQSVETPISVSGTTAVSLVNQVGKPFSQSELALIEIEVTMPYGQNLLTTDEPNGTPSAPFATVDERTEWATANLASLLPGRTTVWMGDPPVDQVWVGPLATEWSPIASQDLPRLVDNAASVATVSTDRDFPKSSQFPIRSGLKIYDVQNAYQPREVVASVYPEGVVTATGEPTVLPLLGLNGGPGDSVLVKRGQDYSAAQTTETISLDVCVNGRNAQKVDLQLVTTRTDALAADKSATHQSKDFRPLIIGDSVGATNFIGRDGAKTGGWGIASFLKEFWLRDNADGMAGSMTPLGTIGNRSDVTVTYKSNSWTLRAFHESRAGWAIATYMRHPVLLSTTAAASTEIQANGAAAWAFLGLQTSQSAAWSNLLSQRLLIRNTAFRDSTAWDYNSDLWDYLKLRPGWGGGSGAWSDTGPNRAFIDAAMNAIKTAPDNPFWLDGSFSLYTWYTRYKTFLFSSADCTTRLVAGSTAGTLVTDVNAIDVHVPTHVIIELGENDRWWWGANIQTAVSNLQGMAATISANFPTWDIKIAFVFTRTPGAYHRLYGTKNGISQAFSNYSSGGYAYKESLSDAAKAAGLTVIDADVCQDPRSAASWTQQRYAVDDKGQQVPFSGFDGIHPGLDALRGVAYQIYGWMLSNSIP